jgi:CRISPR/Cas system-associated exonuclease Cas4 (RecB family)
VSRDRLFRTCQRAYFYNYYGAWGGWKEDAPARTRKLYILKNMKSLPMWAGSIIHDVIANALQRKTANNEDIVTQKLQSEARQQLREGWREAVNRRWEQYPKANNLHELYYGNQKTLPKEKTDRTKQRIYDCLAAFAESSLLKQILKAPYIQWKPIDELDAFTMENDLKVWCAIDFAYTASDNNLRIIDWKTGAEKQEELKLQLACYSLYAEQKWFTPIEHQRAAGVFLNENARISPYNIDAAALIEVKNTILESAEMMKAKLTDPEHNKAEEENFALCNNPSTCRNCNFKEVCPVELPA